MTDAIRPQRGQRESPAGWVPVTRDEFYAWAGTAGATPAPDERQSADHTELQARGGKQLGSYCRVSGEYSLNTNAAHAINHPAAA